MNLDVQVERTDEKYVVKLNGEIDVYTAPSLTETLIPLSEKSEEKVEVDLEHVTYMDSTGLGVFISAYKSAKENQCDLELINARDRVLRLFIVTGLHEIINLRMEDGGV